MKSTGIIRNIDPLGRLVIPAEIRKSHGINAGDPVEMFLGENDLICVRKWCKDKYTKEDYENALIKVCNETGKEPLEYLKNK